MIALSQQRITLSGLGFLLIGLAAWQISAPVSLDLPISPGPQSETKTKSAPQAAHPAIAEVADYSEVEKRPLFVTGRKPPAAAPLPVNAAQSQALSAYSVVGIIAAPDRAVAILHGSNGPPIHLRKGQVLEGWALETIGPNKLTFASGDQRQELDIRSSKNQQGQSPYGTNMGINSQRPGTLPNYSGVSAQ